MRKSFVALLLLLGAAATLATGAWAFGDPASDGDILKFKQATSAQDLRASRASRFGTQVPGNDTTWVGYNPAYAASNYWSIGVGNGFNAPGGTGVWDLETPVQGDSLQGWWTYRVKYIFNAGDRPDIEKTYFALDFGNQINGYMRNGARRTEGVLGVWHVDPGNTITSSIPGTTPVAPSWTPLAGTQSAWCGVRSHGDLTAVDPITGQPIVDSAHKSKGGINNVNLSGFDGNFPGYMSQWDQLLYRDFDVTGAGTVLVRFRFQSAMSTVLSTAPTARTGWFNYDPLSTAPGNYIEGKFQAPPPTGTLNPDAPRDSFMVYVGGPIEPDGDPNNANDFTASDGLTYDVFDAQRRWFSEVVDINNYQEIFATVGNNANQQVVAGFDNSVLNLTTARLVFRVKTDREVSSCDEAGGRSGFYNSGGAGAVQVDDVEVDVTGTGTSYVLLGDFELATDIDNDTGVSASTKWKSTGKPPAIWPHLVNESENPTYQDLCGPIGGAGRICDLAGNFISYGNVDDQERLNGTVGSPEFDRIEAVVSPSIDLSIPALPTDANSIGLKQDDLDATEDIYLFHDLYTGAFTLFDDGNAWVVQCMSYPAVATNGATTWGSPYRPISGSVTFNPDPQCFQNFEALIGNGVMRSSNDPALPDSIRVGFGRLSLCLVFGISTDCGLPNGIYIDNMSIAFIDGAQSAPVSTGPWDHWQDAFPANEDIAIVGNPAAFDTAAAHIGIGLNVITPVSSTYTDTYMVPGDTMNIDCGASTNQRVDIVFRILPGPGNYVTRGDRTSGLRVVPTSPTAIAPGDGSFWATYLDNNGPYGSPGGHPAGGVYAARWSEIVWNSARCDTQDVLIFPVRGRTPAVGVTAEAEGGYCTMLHEDDPNFNTLGILKNRCFLEDTAGATTDVNCGRAVEGYGAFPPAWVTALPQNYTGWDGTNQTREGTKVIPDGILTPGSHVQYFFRREDFVAARVDLVPDTNTVSPQPVESLLSTDGHRWQQFSVLPDAWKNPLYGGLNMACALFVDWNDRRGNERVWVSVMDSIGATLPAKRGAHNGWSGAGGVSVNDPSGFVHGKNAQPGSTWDMYGVKASESLTNPTGTLGSRLSYRGGGGPADRVTGKEARIAPTPLMLETYYNIVAILTGDINGTVLGQDLDRSSNDREILRQYLLSSTAGAKKGLYIGGTDFVFVEDLLDDAAEVAAFPVLPLLSVSARDNDYLNFAPNTNACADLITQAAVNPNGDIYGVDNTCLLTADILNAETGGVPAALYEPVGNPVNFPYVASVYHAPAGNDQWISLVDGWELEELHGRYCATSNGRLAYYFSVFTNVFAAVGCNVQGASASLDTPQSGNGKLIADFMTLGNNPVYRGSAVIKFGLASPKRVTAKIYDVSGRLVRTLVDGQLFKAGEHQLLWDGVSNAGQAMPRGVYFSSWETDGGASVQRKITFLK